MKKITPSRIIITLSLLVAIVSFYILLFIELPNKPLAGQGGAPDNGSVIGGEFTLTDQDGNQFSSEKLKGKLSLIYFGFTYCPDICPTSLQKISKALETLDKYNIEVIPVFITVDPKRDKFNILKEYLGHFSNKFIGLTGTEEEIKTVADKFKVYYARSSDDSADDSNYMVDHSSFVYLMDTNFKYKKHFYLNSPPEEIIEYIRINK